MAKKKVIIATGDDDLGLIFEKHPSQKPPVVKEESVTPPPIKVETNVANNKMYYYERYTKNYNAINNKDVS